MISFPQLESHPIKCTIVKERSVPHQFAARLCENAETCGPPHSVWVLVVTVKSFSGLSNAISLTKAIYRFDWVMDQLQRKNERHPCYFTVFREDNRRLVKMVHFPCFELTHAQPMWNTAWMVLVQNAIPCTPNSESSSGVSPVQRRG